MLGIPTTSDIFYLRRSFFFFLLFPLCFSAPFPLSPFFPLFFQMHWYNDLQRRVFRQTHWSGIEETNFTNYLFEINCEHGTKTKIFHHWRRIPRSNNRFDRSYDYWLFYFSFFFFRSREIMQKYFNPTIQFPIVCLYT